MVRGIRTTLGKIQPSEKPCRVHKLGYKGGQWCGG